MKITVQYDDIRGFELKPSETLTTYLRMTQDDVKTFLINQGGLSDCDCPACLSGRRTEAFHKFGLRYCLCNDCGTLYVSPRPTEQAIDHYYRNSAAHQFWNEQLSAATQAKRREKLFRPRVQWIVDTLEEYFPSARRICDVNTIHRPFIDELIASDRFSQIVSINPFADLHPVAREGQTVEIIEAPIDSCNSTADAVTLLEVLDRLSDVNSFCRALAKLMVPGGVCFLTTISVSGFDLQVLWDKSDSVFPPDRMNVLSTEGLLTLLERHGFECIELSTPGLLDVQIVAGALKENPDIEAPRFVKYLLSNRDEDAHQSFQEFLQMNRLSSFTRLVFQKT